MNDLQNTTKWDEFKLGARKDMLQQGRGGVVYRAMTGLENENGVRVELGETLPPAFVPDAQIAIWLANRDIVVAYDEDSAREDEQP